MRNAGIFERFGKTAYCPVNALTPLLINCYQWPVTVPVASVTNRISYGREKIGIAPITITMHGFMEPVTCQDGLDIP